MNGVFTESESRHLTTEERMHYAELGLCSPAQADAHLASLEYEITRLTEGHADCVADLDYLEGKVRRCQRFVRDAVGLTADQLKAKVLEFLA